MSTFKYLNVVAAHNTNSKTKPDYIIIESNFNNTYFDLILPQGKSSEETSQLYLYNNKNKQAVYVRNYLPETKYTTYIDELHSKDPRKQLELFQREEAAVVAKKKLDSLLMGF